MKGESEQNLPDSDKWCQAVLTADCGFAYVARLLSFVLPVAVLEPVIAITNCSCTNERNRSSVNLIKWNCGKDEFKIYVIGVG